MIGIRAHCRPSRVGSRTEPYFARDAATTAARQAARQDEAVVRRTRVDDHTIRVEREEPEDEQRLHEDYSGGEGRPPGETKRKIAAWLARQGERAQPLAKIAAVIGHCNNTIAKHLAHRWFVRTRRGWYALAPAGRRALDGDAK